MTWRKIRKWLKWTFSLLFLGIFLLLLLVRLFVDFDFEHSPEQVTAFFADKPYQPEHFEFTYRGRTLHYVSAGDPSLPLVVFVHGSPGSWDAFLEFMGNPRLLARARLVSIDRPGYGGSGRNLPEPSLVYQAAVIKTVLETDTGGRPAILVGHSLGAPIVARAAMDFPERVGGLILVAPSIDPELEKVRWFQYPADWQLLSWLVPPALRTSNREVLPLKGELQALLPLWAGISQVVTVIQGEKDVLVPAANADFAVARLVNARVTRVRVPDMNHFVPWTHPSLIEQAIHDPLDLLQPAPE